MSIHDSIHLLVCERVCVYKKRVLFSFNSTTLDKRSTHAHVECECLDDNHTLVCLCVRRAPRRLAATSLFAIDGVSFFVRNGFAIAVHIQYIRFLSQRVYERTEARIIDRSRSPRQYASTQRRLRRRKVINLGAHLICIYICLTKLAASAK